MKGRKSSYFSHELSVNLGDAIDCPWPLNAEIRSWVSRRGGPKGSNSAWNKESQIVLSCNIQNIV